MLMCIATLTSAQNVDDIPANWCRNGLFTSEQAEFTLATVRGKQKTRIHFFSDDDGCPNADAKCKTKSYLVAGDQVVASRKYGSWICSWYQPRKGEETVGWLPADSLVMSASSASPTLQRWTGLWMYGKKSLNIRRDIKSGFLKAKGYAIWEGTGANVHVGGVEAVAQPEANELILVEEECRVSLKLVGGYIVASDNSECGGVNVRFNGIFRRGR